MLNPSKSISDLNEGNERGVCATTAEIVANYAHAPEQLRIRVNPDAKAQSLLTTAIMLSRGQVIHRKTSTDCLHFKLSTGRCGQLWTKPCGQPAAGRSHGEGGGGGPSAKGHGDGSPTNNF